MIAHQLSPALLAFLLHTKDNLSVHDITGKSFCELSKAFQADWLRISMICEILRNGGVQDFGDEEDEGDA